MNKGDQEKIRTILHESAVHARRIEQASRRCSPLFPLTADSWKSLSDNDITHVDQLIYRYTKLQDALGAKLFPRIVMYLREDAESLTVLDKLAVLERAGAITGAEKWRELRELRNQLAHDYEDDAETAAGYLNDLYESCTALLNYHSQATHFVREHLLSDSRDQDSLP